MWEEVLRFQKVVLAATKLVQSEHMLTGSQYIGSVQYVQCSIRSTIESSDRGKVE